MIKENEHYLRMERAFKDQSLVIDDVALLNAFFLNKNVRMNLYR